MIATKLGTILLLGFMAVDLVAGVIKTLPPDADDAPARGAVVSTYGVSNR